MPCSDHDILQQLISKPRNVAEDFSRRAGFPSVVGALDGTYIPISGPSNYRDSYICRKGYPAMHLQAVCDSDLKFLDVFSAYPGSVHDARVFKNSPLYQALQELPPKFHLLGDSAYPLTTFLLTPFRDNDHLSTEQKCYNSAHSSTRVDIERCFGLLKGKFRKLKFLDMHKVEEIPSMIIVCCALHNFIIMHEKDYEPDTEVEIEQRGENLLHDFDNDEGESVSGQCKRQEIMHLLA
ncbi:putative nuclease HARBI1 [Saccostrea echinata]|uniref:putative nuclease HARBI1 n=1 Tax=Saccostrea echinata TaxID=191078 RepID=UPI002A837EF1|nr:putative nuclease HARBI1 [Saccostrea echinata]